MINAKQVFGTYPHVQMRWYVEQTVADEARRPYELSQLVKKYVNNCNEQNGDDEVQFDIDASFIWDDTPEGHGFWQGISAHVPEHFKDQWLKRPKVKKQPAAKPVKPKRVGWWV